MQTGPTLLCQDCNGAKAETWPSDFYKLDATNIDADKIRRLSVRTGISYEILAGPPQVNPEAVEWLKSNIDGFMERWIRYPDEIKRIRHMIMEMTGEDVFTFASIVPPFLKESAG